MRACVRAISSSMYKYSFSLSLSLFVVLDQVDTTILGLDETRAKEMPYIASMGIYVFKRQALIDLLTTHFKTANDFGSEVIPGAKDMGMKVQAYLYDGYWEDIGTIQVAIKYRRGGGRCEGVKF